ncbi:hypothetical protein BES34_021015 [Leptospira inadai serovar Lyme]|uniref:Uncharacterized protein n=1 Tax=Leptospira inadai serovar Lyme TaxID=293084 RepID=A0ABX4YCR7_9LEPT|nr:hypothetical protein BES34_021015 [Leptospira inadai serovar Lyme]
MEKFLRTIFVYPESEEKIGFLRLAGRWNCKPRILFFGPKCEGFRNGSVCAYLERFTYVLEKGAKTIFPPKLSGFSAKALRFFRESESSTKSVVHFRQSFRFERKKRTAINEENGRMKRLYDNECNKILVATGGLAQLVRALP